jgi:hypothetical protein
VGGLQEPLVEIGGITNAQHITWSGAAVTGRASFGTFEHFDAPWRMPQIRVRGGQLESVSEHHVEPSGSTIRRGAPQCASRHPTKR